MANAGYNIAVNSTGTATTTLYDPTTDLPCTTIFVTNRASNTTDLLISIPGMHGTNYAALGPGVTIPFRQNSNGLTKVLAQCSSSNGTTVDFGICSHL
jgi:hypothetical protein